MREGELATTNALGEKGRKANAQKDKKANRKQATNLRAFSTPESKKRNLPGLRVPSFSRARSVSRTDDRLTSNFSANSASPKWSPGLKTSSRIASRILLTTRNVAFSVSCVSFEFLRGEDWHIGAEFPQQYCRRRRGE
jgi:hypothetical protein